ncbi:MAG TPA: 3-isopropylmalate dehydratase small subunit [bacterium]|nr:3-isopropylmalate dehydratase small subunit [bacterium]
MIFRGKAIKLGDNIDTDMIIPARYCNMFQEEELGPHALAGIDEQFVAKNVARGDILVAGSNFGCGSSREAAPVSLKGAGFSCIIAESYARIFYRNAFNIGLPILESAEAAAGINPGDDVEVDVVSGTITDHTTGQTFQAAPFPPFIQELVAAGGMVNYVRHRLAQQSTPEAVAAE